MVQKVIWLKGAQNTFAEALVYLDQKFTDKEAYKFVDKVQNKIHLIRLNPRLGKKGIKKINVYKTVIHKRVVLIYQYKPIKNEIVLLAFWNTRKDPTLNGF